MRLRVTCIMSLLVWFLAAPAFANEGGGFVVRLGRDTTFLERYSRTPTQLLIEHVGLAPRVLQRRFVYDYEKGEFFREIVTDRRVSELAFSEDGHVLYTAGSATSFPGPKGGGAWEVATGEELTSGDTLLVNRLASHPGGAALATFDGDTLQLR